MRPTYALQHTERRQRGGTFEHYTVATSDVSPVGPRSVTWLRYYTFSFRVMP